MTLIMKGILPFVRLRSQGNHPFFRGGLVAIRFQYPVGRLAMVDSLLCTALNQRRILFFET